MFLILLLGFFPISIQALFETCNGTHIIKYDSDSNDHYYFPTLWNENISQPEQRLGQSCNWQIRIPDGYYVHFTMKVDVNSDASLKLVPSNGKNETVMSSYLQPFIFVSPMFQIQFYTGSSLPASSIGFKVVWIKFPSFNSYDYFIDSHANPLVIKSDSMTVPLVFNSTNRVSLVSFAPEEPDCISELRLYGVWDGPNWNSTFLGTLYQVARSNKQLVSSNNSLTVFKFNDQTTASSYFMLQDYSNVDDLEEFKAVVCVSDTTCPVTLFAPNTAAAMVTLSHDQNMEFMTDAILNDTILNVYDGGRLKSNESNLIATYSSTSLKVGLPQKFQGYMHTYVINKGSAILQLAKQSQNWNDVANGRQGFITSRNYKTLSVVQNVFEQIGEPSSECEYNLKLRIRDDIDLRNSTTLSIVFYKQFDPNLVEYLFSNTSSPPNNLIIENGTSFSVNYTTNNMETFGFYMDFSIQRVQTSGSHKYEIFLAVITTISFTFSSYF